MNEKLKDQPILKEKLETFNEALKTAYNSPNHVFKINTPYGIAEVRIKVPVEIHTEEKKRAIKNKKIKKKTQKEIIEALSGAWPIAETADELIARIKGMRKNSRIISLNGK